MKAINKMNLIREQVEKEAKIEVEIMKKKLPFTIHLHMAFQNQRFLYIVEDFCINGDLETLINN